MNDLKQLTILIVEDENDLRRETAAFLKLHFRDVYQAAEGRQALALFDSEQPDMVLTDLRMPVMDGIELATCLKKTSPNTPIVFCTAFTETDYLLKAIELQVAAFIRKPVLVRELIAGLTKAAEPVLLRRQIGTLSGELAALVDGQLGRHPLQQAVAEQVVRVAPTIYNVLLHGETGTGKSHLAGIIHSLSPRRDKPFVTIQLSTVPTHLADSLLFGHLKGAFTGADRSHAGLVERADGGTLFLDDIESCHASVQAKLLRMVELKSFTPVGSNVEKRHDVRIISASNLDLKEEVAAGRFREDLYYRLADITITLPSLRQMPETILPLAYKFLRETSDELGRDMPSLAEEAEAVLSGMPWPGNIRQLKSIVRRIVLNAGAVITGADIAMSAGGTSPVNQPAHPPVPTPPFTENPPPFPCNMDALERWSIEQALRFCGGKKMKTADMLDMSYNTFRRKLEKYGLWKAEE